jgi:hypothetical protein
MLREMRLAKEKGQHVDLFARVLLVYLYTPKDRLCKHLGEPTASGHVRKLNGVKYTPKHYDSFHDLYLQLADRTVDCSARPLKEVAAEVQSIVQSLRSPNV